MVKYFLFALCTVLIIGCRIRYQPLKESRVDFKATNLKINGYYYCTPDCIQKDTFASVVFLLNKNGNFEIFQGYSPAVPLKDVNMELEKQKDANMLGQMGLGIFWVKGDDFFIERWVYASASPVPTAVQKGKVLNDTTIQLNMFGKDCLWYFQQCSFEINRTNNYIK